MNVKKKKKSNGSLKAKLHYTHSKQILFLILPCICGGTRTHRDTKTVFQCSTTSQEYEAGLQSVTKGKRRNNLKFPATIACISTVLW